MKIMGQAKLASAAAVIALITVLLAGCGGGSSASGPSSGSGGVSNAVVQGQVVRSQSAATEESTVAVLLRTAMGIGVAEALPGDPVEGATVKLLSGSTVVATTITDSNGQFVFQGVQPGVYTVQVYVGTTLVGSTSVTVGAGDQAIVGVATNGTTSVNVTAISTDVYNNDAQLGHAINIANASTRCDLVSVTQLREQGYGWGDIAHRCGAHPSVIGLGRSNLTDADLDDARERTGHGRKHGGRGGKGKKV